MIECQCTQPGRCPLYERQMSGKLFAVCQGTDPGKSEADCERYRQTWLKYKGQLDPSTPQKLLNFARDSAKHAADGARQVDDYTRNWRLSQCQACELFDAELETCTHKGCGCGMKKKRGIIDALGWASKRCPIGKWDNPPPPTVLSVYRKTKSEVSIGLGVNANLTASVLCGAGYPAQSFACSSVDELAGMLSTESPPQFVVFEGCWANPDDIIALAAENYRTQFTMRCHSQVAFLQIEPASIGRLHDIGKYSKRYDNVWLSGNSRRFTDWASQAWDCNCRYLPNLYAIGNAPDSTRHKGEALQLASFGAMRTQKHHTVSAAAAVLVAKRAGKPVELYVNSDTRTPGSASILSAVQEIAKDSITLIEVPWQAADDFRKTIAQMDLCFQLSASETFNLVTADAAAAGVPTVCGEAIDWVPKDWHAPVDDPVAAAEVAWQLLNDDTAGERGKMALETYSTAAMKEWQKALAPTR